MRTLTKTETILLLLGGLLMVIGAGAAMLLQSWAVWVYLPGALLFASMQSRQRYLGREVSIRRLRHIQLLSDTCFVLAGLLMLADKGNLLQLDYITYLRYVHNNWVVVLLVAAVLQLYTSHRIANELERQHQ